MDVVTTIEHVSGEAVPKGVGREGLFFKSCFGHSAVYHHLHTAYMDGSFGLLTGK